MYTLLHSVSPLLPPAVIVFVIFAAIRGGQKRKARRALMSPQELQLDDMKVEMQRLRREVRRKRYSDD